MKVLHLSYSDHTGGANRAAYRIHRALLKAGADSRMMVMRKDTADPTVVAPLEGTSARGLARLRRGAARWLAALQRGGGEGLRSLNLWPSGLGRVIAASGATVVNLHWVHDEMISIGEIGAIAQPVVWTLHGMWPFSGAEHYEDLRHPGRSAAGYTPESRPPDQAGFDVDRWRFRAKQAAWSSKRFGAVAPSRWIAGCATRSRLFSGLPVRTIPNCLDLERFAQQDPLAARRRAGLPDDGPLILFGGMAGAFEPRKGFAHLLAAMRLLQRGAGSPRLVLFGGPAQDSLAIDMPVHQLGLIADDAALAQLYAAVDVLALPSVQDNLPNVAVEALACGTPCVAFDVGGMPDLIRHKANGYLAKAFDPADFAAGLRWALSADRPGLRAAARAYAEEQFTEGKVARQYLDFYNEMTAVRRSVTS